MKEIVIVSAVRTPIEIIVAGGMESISKGESN